MNKDLYLLLGSNLEDRINMLQQAREKLEKQLGASIASSFYATAPWGNTDQPDFINQVLKFKTTLPALEVLSLIQNTENSLGRVRHEKWGPRTIDIDILIYGSYSIESAELTVPHPEIANRRFTLEPLCELAAEERHPITGQQYSELLENCPDSLEVRKMSPVEPEV